MRSTIAIVIVATLAMTAYGHSRQPPQPVGQQLGPPAQQGAATQQAAKEDMRGADEAPFVIRPDAATAEHNKQEAQQIEGERRKKADTGRHRMSRGVTAEHWRSAAIIRHHTRNFKLRHYHVQSPVLSGGCE